MKKRPLMSGAVAVIAGVVIAQWQEWMILGIICSILIVLLICFWTGSSWKYICGLAVLFFVGFCRTFASNAETAEMKNEVTAVIYKVDEKEKSVFLYVKDGRKQNILVVLKKKEQEVCPYYKGQAIYVQGCAELFSHAVNPGMFDEANYYKSMGIKYKIWADRVEVRDEGCLIFQKMRYIYDLKRRIKQFYTSAMSSESAVVIQAATLGDRTGFDGELKRFYQKNGWMHLVTISGMHLSLIVLGLYGVLRKAGISGGPAMALSGVVMILYGELVGFGDALLRAMGMVVFKAAAVVLGRKSDTPTSMAVTAVVLILIRPQRILSTGFLLSFCAAAGMELGGWLGEKDQRKKIPRGIWMQIGILICTGPVTACTIYELPLLGYVYNWFMIPLMSLIVPLSVLSGLLGASGIQAIQVLAALPLMGIDRLLSWIRMLPAAAYLSGCPGCLQLVLYFGLIIGFMCLCQRKKMYQGLLIFMGSLLVLFGFRAGKDRIICMDVGQGDGILMMSADRHAVMIDGGSTGVDQVFLYRIYPTLKYYGIREIDGWFITHGDLDHCSGALEAVESEEVKIDSFYFSQLSQNQTSEMLKTSLEQHQIPYRKAKPGDVLRVQSFAIECLYPDQNQKADTENDTSLVLNIRYKDDFSMLCTGDLEKRGEAALMQRYKLTHCQILKVGHHGSSGSTSEALLKAVSPEWAVISCGKNNRYGHPHKETLDLLSKEKCRWVTTQNMGAILIELQKEGYRICGYQKSD